MKENSTQTEGKKKCRGCQQVLPLDQFHTIKNRRGETVLTPRCGECRKEYFRTYQRRRTIMKNSEEKHYEPKSTIHLGPCADCDYRQHCATNIDSCESYDKYLTNGRRYITKTNRIPKKLQTPKEAKKPKKLQGLNETKNQGD